MPKLLTADVPKGWPFYQRLLVDLFKFMGPFLRQGDMSDSMRYLYRGTLRVLLVLLHDFPEFLCDYHFSFVDVIPPPCIQLRNVILSAFPKNMKLPDPFLYHLKAESFPEMNNSPHLMSDYGFSVTASGFKSELDTYLKARSPNGLTMMDLTHRLTLPEGQRDLIHGGTKYNVPLINSVVLYVGVQGLMQSSSSNISSSSISKVGVSNISPIGGGVGHSSAMDIFQHLVNDLDLEGENFFFYSTSGTRRSF